MRPLRLKLIPQCSELSEGVDCSPLDGHNTTLANAAEVPRNHYIRQQAIAGLSGT